MDSDIGTPCSIRFGQNAKTCLDGPDKMPTKKLGRTKCQPQKKVRTICQPLVGIMSGWHFVRLAFCPHTRTSPYQHSASLFRLEQVSERCHHPAVMEEHNHLEKITLKTLSAFLHADTVEAIGSVMQVLKIFLCNLSVMSTTEMCALLRPI